MFKTEAVKIGMVWNKKGGIMTIQLDPHERALIDLIARTQNDLARVIKARRIELDFTQTDLGHRAGIYQSRICDLEKHRTNRLDYIV